MRLLCLIVKQTYELASLCAPELYHSLDRSLINRSIYYYYYHRYARRRHVRVDVGDDNGNLATFWRFNLLLLYILLLLHWDHYTDMQARKQAIKMHNPIGLLWPSVVASNNCPDPNYISTTG